MALKWDYSSILLVISMPTHAFFFQSTVMLIPTNLNKFALVLSDDSNLRQQGTANPEPSRHSGLTSQQ